MSSIKARDQTINALVAPCLKKSIDRAKNLKKEKVFLVFLKAGEQLNSRDIEEEIQYIDNAKFIFFVDDVDSVEYRN